MRVFSRHLRRNGLQPQACDCGSAGTPSPHQLGARCRERGLIGLSHQHTQVLLSKGRAAARLMPDNDIGTARVLCEAGTWLKNRDPQATDRFYKALVRRCGRTGIGRETDQLRWFPPLTGLRAP